MTNLVATFNERKGALLQAFIEHIGISLISLLIAIVIAVPLAFWLTRYKRLAEIMLQITGILQTLPSLALLGLLIPFVGIGTTPAIIALVVYALLPIFQNTYVGLSEIDPSLEEAADAFGMSRLRKLFKVELPLALPIIISGIRTALVLIIGTATLAALIGAGGLGTFILLGIDRNDPSLILLGAISSAILAIFFSFCIQLLQKINWKISLSLIIGIFLLFGGYQIAQQTVLKQEKIVIAGKMGAEPEILINMYKLLIEQDNPKVTVELKPNFGKTSFLYNALKNDQIDIYPEFTGTVLQSLVKVPANQSTQLSAKATYKVGKKLLNEQAHLTYLPPMRYQNTYALAVKKDFAKQYHLQKISDLEKIQDKLHAGFTLEFIDRSDGYKGLQNKYHLAFKVSSMEPALRYKALIQNEVNIIDTYSTDSEIKQYDLTLLKDDQELFPPYQGAALMQATFAKKHPGIVKSLKKLTNQITEAEMSTMNYEVNVKKKTPQAVAKKYLETHQLLKK